ncbi:MAG: nuclear transport factor 2 family protein [Chitinophagaceae bacterium]
MKYFYLLVFTTIIITSLHAQTTEDSVKATVNKLFESMKNSDAAALTTVFADSAILQTIVNTKDGKTIIRNEKISDFSTSIGKLAKGDADERITFETVKTDGALAIVWTPYKFYYKGAYSHCGVNSFQLVRINGQWKIQYLIDTRRKECTVN